MLVVGVIFKAFALTGRKVDCWFTQGECPGLGAAALSGRVKRVPWARSCCPFRACKKSSQLPITGGWLQKQYITF